MDARVTEVLGLVDLPGVQKLAGGIVGWYAQASRSGRAIAIQPEVILYDEPTTGLDPINVRRINGLILSLQQNCHQAGNSTTWTPCSRLPTGSPWYTKTASHLQARPTKQRIAICDFFPSSFKGVEGLLDEDL